LVPPAFHAFEPAEAFGHGAAGPHIARPVPISKPVQPLQVRPCCRRCVCVLPRTDLAHSSTGDGPWVARDPRHGPYSVDMGRTLVVRDSLHLFRGGWCPANGWTGREKITAQRSRTAGEAGAEGDGSTQELPRQRLETSARCTPIADRPLQRSSPRNISRFRAVASPTAWEGHPPFRVDADGCCRWQAACARAAMTVCCLSMQERAAIVARGQVRSTGGALLFVR
jgi:hypothetical protein